MLNHIVKRNALGAFGAAEQQAAVPARNEPFRDDGKQINGYPRQDRHHEDRQQRMREDASK